MTVADLAIIAGLVFAAGTLSARLERFDMTAPIVFTTAGVLLTHGPLAPLGVAPSREVVKVGLLALEDLAGPAAKPALTVIAFTVLLSVLAHGLSADPLARRYGPRLSPPPRAAGPAGLPEIPARRLIRATARPGG